MSVWLPGTLSVGRARNVPIKRGTTPVTVRQDSQAGHWRLGLISAQVSSATVAFTLQMSCAN